MKIGILNTGNIGRSLAAPWLRAGHDLLLATQGSPEKLDAFLRQFPAARGGRTNEAARFGEVVLFSVYWPRFEAALAAIDDLTDKIVIDTMNPLNVNEQFEHTHDLEFMANSSTSEELQKRRPRVRVVKGFSTLPAGLLAVDEWASTATKPSIFLASDDLRAKEIVRGLAREAGFDALDAGPLRAARSIEQLGILLHNVGTHQFKGDYSRLAPTLVRATK